MAEVSGLLVVDKPSGPTSHDVVQRLRRVTGIKRIGHSGTLDPTATGVMVVALGRATRLIRFVEDDEKQYRATIRFGIATNTLDAQGEELGREPMRFGRADLEGVLGRFRGPLRQVPPMVSALKVGGRRLYEMARAGEEVERSPRPIVIKSLELESFEPGDYPVARIEVVCSKGTYVRVLAADVGAALGGRAHLEALNRVRVGSFTLEQALSLDDVERWPVALLPPVAAVGDMARLVVDSDQARATLFGRSLSVAAADGELAILDRDGQLLAVSQVNGGIARPLVVLS